MTGSDSWKDLDPRFDPNQVGRIGVMTNSNNEIRFRVFVNDLQDSIDVSQIEWSGVVSGSGLEKSHTFTSVGIFELNIKVYGRDLLRGFVWVNEVSGPTENEWAANPLNWGYLPWVIQASNITEAQFSGHNDVGDAQKHAYLSALLKREIGLVGARGIMEAHEMTTLSQSEPSRENESVMDLHNNEAGFGIDDTGTASNEELLDGVMGMAEIGYLLVLDDTENDQGSGLLINSQ